MTEAVKPVGWLDEKGEFHRSPRMHFLGLVDEYCGSADHIWSGTSLDAACAAWKDFVARGSKDVRLTGWGCGTIASHREMEERLGEPKGTFACPICGQDTPHQHSAEEIARGRENDAWYAREREKRWEGIKARVAALEARYPPRTPLYTHPPTDGVRVLGQQEESPEDADGSRKDKTASHGQRGGKRDE